MSTRLACFLVGALFFHGLSAGKAFAEYPQPCAVGQKCDLVLAQLYKSPEAQTPDPAELEGRWSARCAGPATRLFGVEHLMPMNFIAEPIRKHEVNTLPMPGRSGLKFMLFFSKKHLIPSPPLDIYDQIDEESAANLDKLIQKYWSTSAEAIFSNGALESRRENEVKMVKKYRDFYIMLSDERTACYFSKKMEVTKEPSGQ